MLAPASEKVTWMYNQLLAQIGQLEAEVARLRGGLTDDERAYELLRREVADWREYQAYMYAVGKVPRKPFSAWLQARVQELGWGAVASATGLSERRLYDLVAGCHTKHGRQYTSIWVTVKFVDRVMVSLGYHLNDVYPYTHQPPTQGRQVDK